MRLLEKDKQDAVLTAACHFFRFHSNFKMDLEDNRGPCGSNIRVITGEEEGLFGWIAVNYLMDGFGRRDESATYGFLDMGGASTQIAFEPSKIERERHADNLVSVRLRLLGGNEIHHQVFVTTWLGYGTNQARERYVGSAITEYEKTRSPTSQSDKEKEYVPDPCLPVGLTLEETPVHNGPSTSHSRKPHTLLGTGSFEQCLKQTEPLLNKDVPCTDLPCLFNGVHVPPIDFSASHFIGVSEYWYSSEHIFGLGGAYDVVQYERAASEFCSKSWNELERQYELLQNHNETNAHEKPKWHESTDLTRLKMQCFKAAWLVNVLHEGIGLPRIVDPGGNDNTGEGSAVKEKAQEKGLLDRPRFQSVDTIGDTAISWTLGKMVIEASKEVPAASPFSIPIKDPLDSTSEEEAYPTEPSHPPFIDFDKYEDKIAHRLPSSLSRHSLGISPLALLFYFALSSIVLFILYRLRYRVRKTIRRLSRGSFKRETPDVIFDAYGMEEGKIGGGTSRPPTPFSSSPPSPTGPGPQTGNVLSNVSHALRRVMSSASTLVRSGSVTPIPKGGGRISPRSSTPAFAMPVVTTSYVTASSRSGASTPTNYNFAEDGMTAIGISHPLGNLAQSRSRNSSQMNLTSTTLAVRTMPYSRSNSSQQLA